MVKTKEIVFTSVVFSEGHHWFGIERGLFRPRVTVRPQRVTR